MIAYNGKCGEFLKTRPHPWPSPTMEREQKISDSLTVIAPRGYVLLSYDGAKRALKAKADADAFFKIMAVKDSIIFYREFQVRIANDRIAAFEAAKTANVADIKLLKRKIFWKNVQLVGVVAAVVVLITKNN